MSRRLRKFWKVVAVGLAIAAALVLAGWFVVLPMMARAKVAQAFADMGAADARFELAGVGLSQLRLADIELGNPAWLRAKSLEVNYTLASLWDGRLTTIDASGISYDVKYVDGSLEFGFAPKGGGAGEGLPLDEFRASDAVVNLHVHGQTHALPVEVTVNAAANGTVRAAVQLAAEALRTSAAGEIIEAADARGKVNIELDANNQLREVRGEIEIGAVSLPRVMAERVRVDAELEGTKLNVRMTADLPGLTAIEGMGWVDVSQESLNGEFTVKAPRFELRDGRAIERAFPQLAGAELGGTFEVEAHLRYFDGEIRPRVRLTAENVRATRDDWLLKFESASGELVVDSFEPLATSSPQRVAIHKAMLFDLPVSDGEIEFTVEHERAVRFSRMSWNMNEYGTFSSEPITIDPFEPVINTQLHCRRVGLNRWLPLLSDDEVQGEGTLGGWITVRINPSADQIIEFGNSYLAAESSGGWVRIGDQQRIQQLVESSGVELGGDARMQEVRHRIIRALQEFTYRELSVELMPQAEDEVVCQILVSGRGMRGPDPVEIGGLTVNIPEFNWIFNQVLIAQKVLGEE